MPPPPRTRRKATPPAARARQDRGPGRERLWGFGILAIILLVSLLRVLHLGFPLERDEGEFGYIAQEILRGVPVYESAYTQKLPGAYLLYALFLSAFGQTATAIHFGLLLVNAAIMGLIFLTLRKTHDGLAGCVGALVFGVMALSPTVFGFAAHATFFVALFALAGLYALVHARERGHAALFFASGVCFGLAFLMKQSGLFFAPLALALLAVDHLAAKPRRPARLALQALTLAAGALAPMLVTAAYYAVLGRLSLLWYWAFQLAGEFSGQVGSARGVRNLLEQTRAATGGFEILWALALAGLVATVRDRSLGGNRYLYATFAAAGAMSVVPGLYFTNHYYVSALPAVGLLVGALAGGAARGGPLAGRRFATAGGVWAATAIGLTVGVAKHGDYYFGQVSDAVVSRRTYPGNPFVESVEIGRYLKRETGPRDRVAVLGSEPQILFYAQRRSASRFVDTYFLTADHPRNREMQREMIRDIERERPRYVVLVSVPMSWKGRPNSPRDILDWIDRYRQGRYVAEGIVELYRDGSVARWGEDARARPPASSLFLAIFRRMDPGGAAAP